MTHAEMQAPSYRVPGLGFTDDQLEQRRKTLGASEVPAVAGLVPYRSPLTVWAEKRGLIPGFEGNPFTEWGLRGEDMIAQKYSEVMGVELMRSETIIGTGDNAFLSCTPDRLARHEEIGLECKWFTEYRSDEFGASHTSDLPPDVLTQVHTSMVVSGFKRWDVAVLLGKADWRVYHCYRDDDIARDIYGIAREFWFDYVLTGEQPPVDGTEATRETLARLYKTHSQEMLQPTPELIACGTELARLKAEIKKLEMEAAEREAILKSAIRDAAGIDGIATWKLDKSGHCSWKGVAEALGAAKPEAGPIIKAYTGEPSRRFLLKIKHED